ncbi:MAG: hypothetical protein QW364_01395 [Thermoplasmatales archaeon]
MNFNEGGQEKKLRMSLYLDNARLSVLDDLRYLAGLDGRGLRAVPDFTDVVDGMVYFFYYILCIAPEDVKRAMLRKLFENSYDRIFENKNSEIILDTPPNYSYRKMVGYTAKVTLLKSSQRKIIDEIIRMAGKEVVLSEAQEYSELIKKIIMIIIEEEQLLLRFFDFSYIGNLYGLLPVTVIKLYSAKSKRLIEFEDRELEKIEFIRSDYSKISELYEIKNKISKVPLKEQPIKLKNELFSARNKLSSWVSDINYVDAFYGYILSVFYLANGYKSLTSLVTDIDTNDILFSTFSKPLSGKEVSLYLHYFAIYWYLLNSLNHGAITYFESDNQEIDNTIRKAMNSGMFNSYDIP